MRPLLSIIAIIAMILVSSCEDEANTVVRVSFGDDTIAIAGTTSASTATIVPTYNINTENITSVTYEVTYILGYVDYYDGGTPTDPSDDTALNEIPEVESVAISNISDDFSAFQANFLYQGVYIIQFTVEDDAGHTGVGSVTIRVGSGTQNAGDLPWGASAI